MKKVYSLLIIFAAIFIISCDSASLGSGNSGNSGDPGNKTTKVSVPVISPAAGDYSEGFKSITISTENKDLDIYYTTDGSEPSNTSNRYTEPFKIIGSKTVKAIAYSGDNASSIVTAQYNLNAGKTISQLGVITGVFGLADNLSDEVKAKLASSTVYITSPDLPGLVKEGKMGESFYIDGLDTSKSYDFYFSNKAPGTVINSRAARAARTPAVVQTDEDGEPIVSVQIKTVPDEGAGTDLGQVILKPTGTITGKALKYNETGEEEADHAGITVFIPGTSFAAYTSNDGTFSMTGVPQGMYTIRAMFAGYTFSEQENILLATETSDEPRAEIDTDFTLYYSKGTAKGTVLLDDAPGSSAGISIVLTDSINAHSYTASTTSSGSWIINDITPATYNLEVHKDGYIEQTVNDIIVTGAKITQVPRIILKENGGSITGKVFVSVTTNLAGINVLAKREATENETEKQYYALTKEDGTFTFESVSPGTYTVTATYMGYKSAVQENIIVTIGNKTDTGLLSITEKSTYSVTGLCVLAGMDSDFEGTNVLLQSTTDSKNQKSTTTNIDGVYIFSDVDIGNYTLTFSRQGFITDTSVSVTVGLKAVVQVESVALKTNVGTVTGNVSLESSDSNEGISILISNENKPEVTYTTVTDSNGHFAVAGVKPGTYRVQATKGGFTTGISDPFIVSSGIVSSPSDMLLKISLRSLYGTVKLEGKTDYTGIRITATKTTSTKEIYSALSNKEGFYALSGMTPGEYILSYSYESYRSYTSSSVSLTSDSSLELDEVELAKATGKISGIVNLEGCTNHSGITVSLVGTDYVCTTQADGAYEFTVPSGNYPGGVRFEKQDYQLTAKAETIPVLTDSTYGVLTVEMKAVANTLKGIVNLAGTDDNSGIIVSVDGQDSNVISFTTTTNGEWVLEHVPLGYQTIRFSKVNVPDVTVEIEVTPSDYIDIGSLEMLPDSATLKGFVFLEGMSDNAGITITISTLGKDDIAVRTSSDGAFNANNILASGEHTITFSKDGWNSQTIKIDDFEPLEERTIGANREYVLKDTLEPSWGSTPIVINGGANFANNTKLHFELSPVEKGSGIEKMSIQIARTNAGETGSLYPSTYNWQNYQIGFDFDLNDLPDQYVGNGTYNFYIALKDKSGNISDKATKAITITDLITSLSGVLTGDKLHLTEENSPYLVEADCLVSEDHTLVIDPGVEVRFASGKDENGNTKLYSILISGSIEARGTAEKKILFTKAPDNEGKRTEQEIITHSGSYQYIYKPAYWNGIAINGGTVTTENTYNYVSGNIMEYCEFEYANTPLTIKAMAYINKCNFHDCLKYVYVYPSNLYFSAILINNIFENGLYLYRTNIVVNNQISSCLHTSWMDKDQGTSIISNNSFSNATLDIGHYTSSFALIYNNTFENCSIFCSSYTNNSPTLNNNNFIDCPSPILSTNMEYTSGHSYNFIHNYWGSAQTDELNSKGNEANISFIYDYYDNFNYARFDYSNWATEPFENCGYSETGFVAFDYSVDSSVYLELPVDNSFVPETKETTLPISMKILYKQNPITAMRFAQSEAELEKTPWQTYSENTSFTVDKTKAVNGMINIFAQIKDSEGNISQVISHEFIYDMPVIATDLEDGKKYDARNTKTVTIKYAAKDNSKIKSLELYSNDKLLSETWNNNYYDEQNNYVNDGYSHGSYTFTLTTLTSGNYPLKIVAKDIADNITEKDLSFSVVRGFALSDTENVSYDTTTGQLLKDDNTLHLWHLDNDSKEDSGTAEITNYTHSNGGFEGAASWLIGYVPLDISTNAFTIEFWTRGTEKVEIGNNSVFLIENYFYSIASYNNLLRHYYTTTDKVSNSDLHADYAARSRSDNQWHYWTYVYNGTYSAIYCDGVCVNYQDDFTHTLNTNNYNIKISSDGIIDELRISNCARSIDEINSYYKTAKPILDANTGSLNAIIY